ncbi:MAG: transposase [Candidatus Spechtbacterales bacterium]
MPRKNRQFKVGGVYHIINRGVEKRNIFLKSQDYSRFILGLEFFNRRNTYNNLWELIAEAGTVPASAGERLNKEREKNTKPIIEILAFALMPNHYHLILREIQDGGTSLFMRKMGGYSTYFNKQNERVGPLFQGRYKAVTIENDNQLTTIFNYVHTNPIGLIESGWKDLKVKNKKKAIDYLYAYKWSSFHDYIGQPKYPHLLQKNFYLDIFGSEKECQQVVEDWINFKAENAKLDKKILE